ncbi:extensin [Aliihoeflea aestuarii]|uniref:extensin-like domain-containing protein n=1 Tax=Aliihoeflea aestuarii TaxID=453840 RepID=UPI002094214C|nr:extensin family protein [Aliihoeflea aestuarii]MCO6393056.1 extensin [Aliihoeflea aestuarii]
MRKAFGAYLPGKVRVAAGLFAVTTIAFAFSSCSVIDVMSPEPRVAVGETTSSIMPSSPVPSTGMQRLVPSNPMMVGYPRMNQPVAPQGFAMPAEEAQCRQQLRRMGVTFTDLAPINDGGSCRIDHPIRVSGLAGNVEMKPAATLNCQMALAFASWTRSELAPSARWRYLSGVKTIHQGSSYSCRRIAGTSVASEHSKGNALDVMRIELRNGRDIDVRKPGWFAFRERALLNNVRSGGCSYFTTVLGPGYNAAHADHFHFDLKGRRNGYVACR